MNNITITGHIGKDIEVRQTAKSVVGNFNVADKQFGDKPALWWRCALWGDRVEKLAKYLTKGTQVTVAGTVSEDSYTDKDGLEKKVMCIRVSDIALQGGGSGKSSGGNEEHEDVPF